MGYINKRMIPQYGLTMKEMTEGVKGYWGRRIIVRRSGVDIPMAYTVTLGLDAELPEQMIKSTKIHYGGRIIDKQEQIPEGKICEGANVYYQLIEMSLKNMKLTKKSIEDELIYGFKVLPDTKWARKYIDKKIDEMFNFGYLGTEEEKVGRFMKIIRYFSAIPVITSDTMHDLVEGFEPVSYHILKFIEEEGSGDGVTINELKEEFITRRRWIRNKSELDDFLNYLLMNGCILFEGNKVKFKKPLPINNNERG